MTWFELHLQALLRDPDIDQILIERRLNQPTRITYRRRPALDSIKISFSLDLGDKKIAASRD